MLDKHYLTPLFAPRGVLVLTGSEAEREPLAAAVCTALRAQRFEGSLHWVDVQHLPAQGEPPHSPVDLAVLVVPPAQLLDALDQAVRMRCKCALILTHGVDAPLARQLHSVAAQAGLHLLGPNAGGLQRPELGLNASALGPLAQTGPIGLVCQSGALTAATLDWARHNGVGFSSVVALGADCALGTSEAIDFLAHDPQTQSIVVYMEEPLHTRRFMSALRSAAHAKPVIVLKAVRAPGGAVAAQTHSGAQVDADLVFDAALRRAGAVRVHSFVELFSAAKSLVLRQRPAHHRLAIVTNGRGPGVLAAERAVVLGLAPTGLSAPGAQTLAAQLPAAARLEGLLDLSQQAEPSHYAAAVKAALAAPDVDGVVVLFAPSPGIDPAAVAQALADTLPRPAKTLLACWMGDASMGNARALLASAQIPSFRTPEAAVGAFANLLTFHHNQQLLLQTPPPHSPLAEPDTEGARLILQGVLAEHRQVLTERESKALLAAFHIPVTSTALARSAHEAMVLATQLGFPVALKIDAPELAHKSDVGGVVLHLHSAAAVRDAYTDMLQRVAQRAPHARIQGVTVQKMAPAQPGREVCIGMATDARFGPVISFGAGGAMIELLADCAVELPPLNAFLAQRLIDRTRIARTLGAWHGAAPAQREALEHILLRVSEMVCALPQLREMDINPLIVDANGAVAVDARIVAAPVPGHLAEAQPSAADRPRARCSAYAHLCIQPYPAHHTQVRALRGEGDYLLRPIRPDDAQRIQRLVRELSPASRYFRFASRLLELAPSTLARLTLIDYDRAMALVAVARTRSLDAEGQPHTDERIIAVARYATNPDQRSCEFALLVADDFAGQGLGASLMQDIMAVAREQGLAEIQGLVLRDNTKMLSLMQRLGFSNHAYPDEPEFRLVTHTL